MAKLALTVVGAGIGFMIGGPMGAQIGAMAGGIIGNALFAPTIKGPRMTDLSITASTYGNTIPELYGTLRMSGNVIWSAGIKEHKHKSGGKGGPKQESYTYTASFAIGFCKGATEGVTRIWADGKLIAGAKPEDRPVILDVLGVLNLTKNKKGKFKYRFYVGDEVQGPDSTIVADKGRDNTPAYRGLCYLVFIDMPLEDFGNRIPQITAEITRQPKVVAPYVDLATDVAGGYSVPSNWGSNSGSADWDNNSFYKYNGTTTEIIHYDMRTMQELYRVPVSITPAGNYPAFNPSFSVGGKYFFANTSLHNSGTADFWDATTGQQLITVGHESNGGPASVNADTSSPFVPTKALIGTFDAKSMWFRALGLIDQSDFVYHAGNLGNSFVIWAAGLGVEVNEQGFFAWPAHYSTFPFDAARNWTPMRGKEVPPSGIYAGGQGNSDLLLLNNKFNGVGLGWDCWIKRINLIEMTLMTQPKEAPFVMSNSMFTKDDDILLPRPFPGYDFAFTHCAFDRADNGVVLWGTYGHDVNGNNGKWCFVKYLLDEGEYKWAWKDTDLDPDLAVVGIGGTHYSPAEAVGYPADSTASSYLDGGTIGWMRGAQLHLNSGIYTADLQTGKVILANIPSPLPNFQEGAWAMNSWDDNSMSIMGAPTRVFVQSQGEGVSLQAIVDDVLTKTGMLEPGVDWDSTALSDIMVHGYSISRDTSAADVLKQLAGAYFFDGVESDYIIKMNLRGGASVGTIEEKHLAWVENRDISLKETRTQELELPMRVTINYSDTDRDYQEGSQSAKRNSNPFPTMHSHTEVKIDFPLALSASEAKQIADKTLKMAWSNRWSYKMKFPWEYLKYDPTDIVDIVSNEGFVYKTRLSKVATGVDYNIQIDAVSEKPAAYTSVAVGDPGSGVPIQIIASGGPVDLVLLNTPLLRDTDDTQGVASIFYATAKARSPGDFGGAYLFEATDGTATEYENIDSFGTEPTWGVCREALPPRTDYSIDTKTVLTVRVMSLRDDFSGPDTLESCSIDELLAGRNAALVGGEIIQYQTAELQPDGRSYKLSNILRGRRGTNYAINGHVAGETFVTLDTSTLVKEVNAPAEWAMKHFFKAVSKGQYEEDVLPTAIDMQPNDLKPYTPECVKAKDDGTNVTITFERRSRITNDFTDLTDQMPYREGQGSLAKFTYKVYANKDLADEPWTGDVPSFTGSVPIYAGVDFAPLTFNFPMAGVTEFVVQLYEVGFVDGFPKFVHFKKVGPDWDMTELY